MYESRITALRNEQALPAVTEEMFWNNVLEEQQGPGNLARQLFKEMRGSLGAESSLRRDISTRLSDTHSDIWTEMHLMN